MGNSTKISWTDATWNPIRGCSRVSEGCRNCYAETTAGRSCGPGQPYEGLVRLAAVGKHGRMRWTGEVRFVAEHLADPLRWRKPRRIFVNSMSDLFHESLSNEQIAAVFGVMAAAPQHTFQVLTKRARRMMEWFEWIANNAASLVREAMKRRVDTRNMEVRSCLAELEKYQVDRDHVAYPSWPLPNVWIGVSVENQDAADERIPELLQTPAAVRFLSCEPLLETVDLNDVRPKRNGSDLCSIDSLRVQHHLFVDDCWSRNRIDWVIAGCESGAGARPCSADWLRSLRDQCAAAEVPFFLKQAKEPPFVDDREDPREVGYPSGPPVAPTPDPIAFGPGSKRKRGGIIELPYLDGVQHAAFPAVRR